MKVSLSVAALGIAALVASPLAAQGPARLFVEGRAGVVVPTFKIADVAETGFAVGGTLGYRLNDRLVLFGEFDLGKHKDQATESIDINTLHYVAKLGYQLTPPADRGLEVLVNLGVGAVTFDVEGGERFTYPAINAGAKVAYNVSPTIALVFSPQGDIAFSKDDEVGTSNSWVWPVTAGLRIRF